MSKPVRMCINCRNRFYQNELIRLQCIDKKIAIFSGVGRSFYICISCIDDKKLSKSLARLCKTDPNRALKMLKEII
jgi:predicted RNA-binding protein YlxR (DUF448 family)